MGGGSWSADAYDAHETAKAAAGRPTFDYSDDMLARTPPSSWTVHEDLDPKKINGSASPNAGRNIREAFDSEDHPASTPIAVIFDVTGSMLTIPRVLQQKLPQLHGLLMRKGYVEHPQILFGAIGDAYCDMVPLQIGQFESDNRMDQQLEHIVLEGGGGGGNHESYQLAAYFLARHVDLDSLKRRGKKGYLFFIGDERLYSTIDRRQVEALIGDSLPENLSTAAIFEELKSKFEVFFLFAVQGSYEPEGVVFKAVDRHWEDQGNVCYWRDLLGQNVVILKDANAVCETIALTLGMMEGTITLEEGISDLEEIGTDPSSVEAAGTALALIGASSSPAVQAEGGNLPELSTDGKGTTRL